MKVTKFREELANCEAGVYEMSIAQISELLKCVREILIKYDGPDIYKIIHKLED